MAARRAYKRAKRALIYGLLRVLAALVGALPERLAWSIGRAVGAIAHAVAARDRRRAQHQIAAALPALDAAATTRALFAHLGLLIAELAQLAHARDPARTLEAWVELPDASREVLTRALSEAGGKGAIAVSAHLGNWELLPQRLAGLGLPISTVARANANQGLDRWIARLRARAGITTIRRDQGSTTARHILRALRAGHLFALLVDQDTKVQSALVPFFGRQASTPIAAAELALRGDRPLIVGFIRRTTAGRHRVTVERIPTDGLDVLALTALLTARIEAEVRAVPEQWVWLHRRWRRSPDGPGIDVERP